MANEANIFKQKFYYSCLVTSLLMISGAKNQELEEKIFFDGAKRDYDFYLNSMLASFVKNTGKSLEVFVDNKFLTGKLSVNLEKYSDKINIVHKQINPDLIAETLKTGPFVIYLDDNYLGDYSHASHFVVVNSVRKDGRFQILDPANGKRKYLTANKLSESVESLKKHIKICPIIIRVK